MKGRKPTPTKLRVLRGNPGKRALPKAEPQPSTPITLESPDWLRPDAKQIWFQLAPEFSAQGILTASDVPALAIFCTALADLRRSEIHLEKEGDMIDVFTKAGVMTKENPWYYVKARAIQQCDKFAVQFGIGASYRAKLSLGGEEKQDEFSKWKTGKGKG